MLSFIYVIVHVCDLFCIEASLCMSFYHLLDWDSINRFNPPHLFTCLKSGPGFTTWYAVIIFILNYVRWEMKWSRQ